MTIETAWSRLGKSTSGPSRSLSSTGKSPMTIKPKKLTYRFLSSRGEVRISGFGEEEYHLPAPLKSVGERYGFETCETNQWFDGLDPDSGPGVDLKCWAAFVSFTLTSGRGKGRDMLFCSIESAPSAKAKEVGLVIYRAWKSWNKAGRHIGGTAFVTAMDEAIKKVNEGR